MFHVTSPRRFHGCLFILGLGLATNNLPTKFEISTFARYEDMKRGSTCEKWGGLVQLGVTQCD